MTNRQQGKEAQPYKLSQGKNQDKREIGQTFGLTFPSLPSFFIFFRNLSLAILVNSLSAFPLVVLRGKETIGFDDNHDNDNDNDDDNDDSDGDGDSDDRN